jgi:methylphosphotriester-DNA--protein-cysteine methyltransferase
MVRQRRFFVSVLLLTVVLVASLALAADFKYVGSKQADKYHYPTCQWAKKLRPANLVTFKSAKGAQEAGYLPCKVCRPPVKD